jgi:predicted NBD/HSP70 family sugar kinase
MSLPTLSQNLNELMEMGLLDNSIIAESTGGRKPRILSVVHEARFAIGAELSPHHIRLVAVDLGIHELGYKTIERTFRPNVDYALGLANDIESFIDGLDLDRGRLLGVGITLPGIISADQTIVESAPTLKIIRLNTNLFNSHIPYPLVLSNDANAGGFAEWWNRTNLDSIAYLSLGRGVGGAILMNGVPYTGLRQRSGEFGHMCIHPEGAECSCGRQGCLEAYCSSARLSDDLGITLEEFFVGLEAGNPAYQQIWRRYLDDLSIGIVNIHTALDCDVVLGGLLTQFLGNYMGELEKRISRLDSFWDGNSYLHLCRYHAKSNSIGAALRFIDAFLNEI